MSTNVDKARIPMLPLAFARRHGVAVASAKQKGDDLNSVALIAREDCPEQIWREARRLLGCPVTVTLCPEQTVLETLERNYGNGFETSDAATLKMDLEIEDVDREGLVTDLLDGTPEAPVIQLINTLLRQALQRSASDLHVEPMERGLRVRMRLDGILRTVMERHDAPAGRVASRLKVMAGLDIAETRLPQDGRIALRFGGRSVDVRVSTLPSKEGERVVLRILDKSTGLFSLEEIGLSTEQQRGIERMVANTNGIVLVTGPTGSGKTTTLYSIIRKLNDSMRNILTVEDPVEYDLAGIGQTQVNAAIGMTFARSLRAILRQDPDVVFVGEIRDGETASIAVQAALTGHLVLSTLHTNTAIGAVTRLRDLGVEPYLLSSTIRGLVSQRLVRRVCQDCGGSASPTSAEAALFERNGLSVAKRLPRANGCSSCDNTGYRGRLGVYEIVNVDPFLREMIHDNRPERELTNTALPIPGRLAASSLMAVTEGRTTVAEAVRAVAEDE